MFVNPFHALLALVAIAGVSAQSLNLSDCGQACLTSSAANSTCSPLTNVTCACTDTTFQNVVVNCIGTCSNATNDLSQLESYNEAVCNTTNSTNSSSTSLSPSTSTPTSTSKSNSTSNAFGTSPFGQLPLLSAFIAIAGATIVGAFA